MTDTKIVDLLDKLNTLKGHYSEDTILNINTDSVPIPAASKIKEVLQSKGRTIKDLITLCSGCSLDATILHDYLVVIEETIINAEKALVLRFVINQGELDRKRDKINLILYDIAEDAEELAFKAGIDEIARIGEIREVLDLCESIESAARELRRIIND